MSGGQVCVADNGVHGCADVMRHIEQEGGFGPVRALGVFRGDLQFCIQLLRVVGGFSCGSLGFERLLKQLQDCEQNNCHKNAAAQQNHNEVVPYKLAKGNLPRGAFIHRQSAGKHIGRHGLDCFVQDGQQDAVSAIDRKAGFGGVWQRNAVKVVFLAVIFLAADPCDKAVRLSVLDQLCRVLLCSTVHDFPLRIINRKVPCQREPVLGNGNAVRLVFVKVLFVRDRHHVRGPRCVGAGNAVLFRQIGTLVEMENHVDFARFQRIEFRFFAVITDHLEFQFLIAQTIFGKLNIVGDCPGNLPCGRVIGADAAVACQKAHLDGTVFFDPRLFLARKDGGIIQREIPFIQIRYIKRLRFVQRAHCTVQFFLDVGAVFVDCIVDAGASHAGYGRDAKLCPEGFFQRNKAVDFAVCQLLLYILIVGDVDVLRFQVVFFFPFGQHHLRLGSHQNADCFAVQRFEIGSGDVLARKIGVEVVFFFAHRLVRKQHFLGAVRRIGNIAHNVDFAVFEFFKAVGPVATHILELPACIAR